MTLQEKLNALKGKIKSLANKEAITEDESKELSKMLAEAKSLDLQITAAEYGGSETPPEKTTDPVDDRITQRLEPIIKALEKIPGLDAAGYLTNMGGTQDVSHKSFGDFLLAVRRRDLKRIEKVYGTKTLEEDAGSTGAVLVPHEYHNTLLKMAANASQVVPLCTSVPVGTDAGSYPALDQFTAPTAGVGDTALAAGLTVAEHTESGTIQTDEPAFTEIKYRVYDVGDLVYVSKNLQADSPQSIEAILRGLFAIAIAAKKEFYVFRGTGVGSPLGILNSSAGVAITPATNNLFSYADAAQMISRFKSYLSPGRFFMHPGVFPDTASWEIGTAGAGVAKVGDLGYGGVIFSEHLPQDDNAGDVILADLGAYLFFDREQMTVDFSEHAAFTTRRVVWRVNERLDGMPWLKGTITLADPQGSYTVSPFVYHND